MNPLSSIASFSVFMLVLLFGPATLLKVAVGFVAAVVVQALFS